MKCNAWKLKFAWQVSATICVYAFFYVLRKLKKLSDNWNIQIRWFFAEMFTETNIFKLWHVCNLFAKISRKNLNNHVVHVCHKLRISWEWKREKGIFDSKPSCSNLTNFDPRCNLQRRLFSKLHVFGVWVLFPFRNLSKQNSVVLQNGKAEKILEN